MKRKAYIACPWPEKATGRVLRDILASRGIACTATWLDRPDEPYDLSEGEAREDERDVRRANMLVLLVPDHDTSRGGRDTELGMALALGHAPIHLIGTPRQVFHSHPRVDVFPTIEEWEASL